MNRIFFLTGFAVAAATLPTASWAEKAPITNTIELPKPPAGKSQVVWFRKGGLGPIVGCSVKENGQKISSLGTGRYFIMVAEPGTRTYEVSSEATDTLVLELKPDETKFASCKIGMGLFIGRPKIDLSTEEQFRKAAKLKMVDADDMGPAEGALRPEQVAEALKASASPKELITEAAAAQTPLP